ncbi:defective in cullin neddylation 1, putative [Acanthamoeba castellanii str. Neff]|uniref:Defective in cullin neddylation protein n=1 Tax=Acanthamoeba castellanii (strain ATCC 30010 / Neff) TaxID=1257118 RepID=L8H1R9_ACACF|nr:defective in cullin neddylation 1, putative [Acanthamoeba castellanii str. Neff]ELR19180.1 defective in cullin neddylation 1, putative [Acanthamoeba castellanii str. Neff]
MVCLLKRLVLATILVVSCSAAAAITFFFAPLWGLMLLGVPIFMGVYLCITAFTGDPEMGGWPSLRRKKNELGEKDAPLDQNQPQPPTEAPLPWERGYHAKFKSLARVEFARERLEHLYARYRTAPGGEDDNSEDEDEDIDGIRRSGIELMSSDVGVDPDDVRTSPRMPATVSFLPPADLFFSLPASSRSCLVLTWRLAAKTMGMFTHDEFISGLQALKVDSVPKLRHLFERQLPADLKNPATLQEIWRFAFAYAKGKDDAKIIDLNVAEVLITLLLQPPAHDYPHVQPFLEFLSQQTSCKALNLDQWTNLLDFLTHTKADLSIYDEAAAWPVLFDEYVEWARKNRQ